MGTFVYFMAVATLRKMMEKLNKFKKNIGDLLDGDKKKKGKKEMKLPKAEEGDEEGDLKWVSHSNTLPDFERITQRNKLFVLRGGWAQQITPHITPGTAAPGESAAAGFFGGAQAQAQANGGSAAAGFFQKAAAQANGGPASKYAVSSSEGDGSEGGAAYGGQGAPPRTFGFGGGGHDARTVTDDQSQPPPPPELHLPAEAEASSPTAGGSAPAPSDARSPHTIGTS
eukprot:gene9955-18073_t